MANSNENGRSMIEMLGVLAIVGVLSVGGIAGYSKAMRKYKTDRLVNQFSELVMNIRTLYINQKDFSNISPRILLNSGSVPRDMFEYGQSTDDITHIYSGKIYVVPSLLDTDIPHAFELYADKLNSHTCIALATMDWGSDPSSGFTGLYIGTDESILGTAVMKDIISPAQSDPAHGIYTPGQHENAIPLPPVTAVNACVCKDNCIIGLKYH